MTTYLWQNKKKQTLADLSININSAEQMLRRMGYSSETTLYQLL